MFWRGFYLPSSIFISSFAGAPSPTGDAVLSPGGVRQLHQMRVAGPLQLKIVYSTPFCAIPAGSCGHKRQQSICQTFWEEVTVAVLPRCRVFQRLLLLPFLLQPGRCGGFISLSGQSQGTRPSWVPRQPRRCRAQKSDRKGQEHTLNLPPGHLGICWWDFCG